MLKAVDATFNTEFISLTMKVKNEVEKCSMTNYSTENWLTAWRERETDTKKRSKEKVHQRISRTQITAVVMAALSVWVGGGGGGD